MTANGFSTTVQLGRFTYEVTNMRQHENPNQDRYWDDNGVAVFRTVKHGPEKLLRGSFLSVTSKIAIQAKAKAAAESVLGSIADPEDVL